MFSGRAGGPSRPCRTGGARSTGSARWSCGPGHAGLALGALRSRGASVALGALWAGHALCSLRSGRSHGSGAALRPLGAGGARPARPGLTLNSLWPGESLGANETLSAGYPLLSLGPDRAGRTGVALRSRRSFWARRADGSRGSLRAVESLGALGSRGSSVTLDALGPCGSGRAVLAGCALRALRSHRTGGAGVALGTDGPRGTGRSRQARLTLCAGQSLRALRSLGPDRSGVALDALRPLGPGRALDPLRALWTLNSLRACGAVGTHLTGWACGADWASGPRGTLRPRRPRWAGLARRALRSTAGTAARTPDQDKRPADHAAVAADISHHGEFATLRQGAPGGISDRHPQASVEGQPGEGEAPAADHPSGARRTQSGAQHHSPLAARQHHRGAQEGHLGPRRVPRPGDGHLARRASHVLAGHRRERLLSATHERGQRHEQQQQPTPAELPCPLCPAVHEPGIVTEGLPRSCTASPKTKYARPLNDLRRWARLPPQVRTEGGSP